MSGTVALHILAHTFVEFLTIFREIHVDKVYDNDTAHIAQASTVWPVHPLHL
jgi:hypothetical protein